MTRTQAIKEAQKRWGKKALVRAHEQLSSPERRADAAAQLTDAAARIEAIDREVAERLAVLDWYQALIAERKTLRAQKETANSWRSYYKFSVGQDAHGFAFMVLGKGDTWEEAFADADKHRKD